MLLAVDWSLLACFNGAITECLCSTAGPLLPFGCLSCVGSSARGAHESTESSKVLRSLESSKAGELKAYMQIKQISTKGFLGSGNVKRIHSNLDFLYVHDFNCFWLYQTAPTGHLLDVD